MDLICWRAARISCLIGVWCSGKQTWGRKAAEDEISIELLGDDG